ncbi:MAG: hypothetical protein AB1589_21055 [Cyanobacteriota bacterium]
MVLAPSSSYCGERLNSKRSLALAVGHPVQVRSASLVPWRCADAPLR